MKDEKSTGGGGCPFGHSGEPRAYGESDLTYNDYLKIPGLLKLQVLQSDPPHHDEMLFIIIHQAYELWFKLILHELKAGMTHMEAAEPLMAFHFINRSVAIMKLLVQQIHILETMKPVDFLRFRDKLMPASGFQSLQFRELEFVTGLKDASYLKFFEGKKEFTASLKRRLEEKDLGQVYFEMLNTMGYKTPTGPTDEERKLQVQALLPIYQSPNEHLSLYMLSEALLEFDEHLGLWRDHHVRVIERIIGHKMGSGGSSGVGYLKTTVSKKCFPALWEVRTHLR